VRVSDEFPLPKDLVEDSLATVRLAGRWNRNRWWSTTSVEFVTSSLRELKRSRFGWNLKHQSGVVGWCCYSGRDAAVWVSPTEPACSVLQTLIHEFAHAIVSRSSSHDVSWRRLYLLGYGLMHASLELNPVLLGPQQERLRLPLHPITEAERLVRRYTKRRIDWWERTYAETLEELADRRQSEVHRTMSAVQKFVQATLPASDEAVRIPGSYVSIRQLLLQTTDCVPGP
jgi:hypothetical protein